MKPLIVVIGSSNTDMVITADHLPGPGETILGGSFFLTPGGKGANQAVAAARMGGNIHFICKTGKDIFGKQSLHLFAEEGIDISHAISDPDNPSGVALITVDKKGENCIVVASGANATLNVDDLEAALPTITHSSIILLQLEIPLDTVNYIAGIAAEHKIKVILNPAPACKLPDALFNKISIITPNQSEAELMTGITITDMDSAKKAAQKISERGVETVVITMGSKGAVVWDANIFTHIQTIPVDAVDTTAAGDVFNGALAVALTEGKRILQATAWACIASSLSVTKPGAQASIPFKKEVDEFIANNKQLSQDFELNW